MYVIAFVQPNLKSSYLELKFCNATISIELSFYSDIIKVASLSSFNPLQFKDLNYTRLMNGPCAYTCNSELYKSP